MIIVSVHLPKTAGTSFGTALARHFCDRLTTDYGPRNGPVHLEPIRTRLRMIGNWGRVLVRGGDGAACIHGHFLALKYLPLAVRRDVRFVTWLRDPVERLVSQYHHARRAERPEGLGRRIVEEDWSLERFCLGPEVRNFYRQFLWGFPPARFDFIGITEHYEEDFARFARDFLGASLPASRENVNREREGAAYHVDAGLRRRIEAHHARDMELYRWALDLRARRSADRIPG